MSHTELSVELRRLRRGLPLVRHLLHDGHERVATDGGDGLRLPRHIQQHAKPLPHAAQGHQLSCFLLLSTVTPMGAAKNVTLYTL